MSNTDVQLLSLTEVADLVGRPPRTVQWWAKEGRLPTQRVGGRYVVAADDLPIAEELAEHRGRRARRKTAPAAAALPPVPPPAPVSLEDPVDAEIRGVNEWLAEQRLAAAR